MPATNRDELYATTEKADNRLTYMAKLDEIEKRIDARVTNVIIGAWALALVLIGWLGAGTAFLFSMHGDIQAIKQYEKDHGGEIVKVIENPANTEQLADNLALVAAQLKVARAEHHEPSTAKLAALQTAVGNAVIRNPNLPEAWQAAVELVDYKYQSQASVAANPPNCLDTLMPNSPETDRLQAGNTVADYKDFSGPQVPLWMAHLYLGHCVLRLDDDGHFGDTSAGKFFAEVRLHHPQATTFVLVLNDAQIVYSGGKMIPVSGIQFENCTFEFKPSTAIPDLKTRSMATQLLASNISAGKITIPTV